MWIKEGLIYSPSMKGLTHAYCPTIYKRQSGELRVYFSSRDKNNIGCIYYIVLDKKNPTKVLFESKSPVLINGDRLDKFGVAPSQLVYSKKYKILFMYYFGFSKRQDGSDAIYAGVATSLDDGDTFTKAHVLFTDETDKFPFKSSLYSLNNKYIYYTRSITDYNTINSDLYKGKCFPKYGIYRIKRRFLNNLLDYMCLDENSEPFLLPAGSEFGVCRPWIHYNIQTGFLGMWYSVRSEDLNYRIRYIEKIKGVWIIKDAGITVSKTGWDSDMVCFSSVFDVDNTMFMLYNGNGHGKDGIGLAWKGVGNGSEI